MSCFSRVACGDKRKTGHTRQKTTFGRAMETGGLRGGHQSPSLYQKPTSLCYTCSCMQTVIHTNGGETGNMAEAAWQEVELQKIGTYAIDRQLSTSPASSLYISKQRKKDLIVKVFHPPLPTLEAKEAFLAHAKQLKKLKHRYIIDIQDYGLTQHTGEDY